MLASFLNFCYLVRRSHHTEDTLQEIEEALAGFDTKCDIFLEEGVHDTLLLPRQHSLASTTTLARPLHRRDSNVWLAEWSLLVNHRITPYNCGEATLETV